MSDSKTSSRKKKLIRSRYQRERAGQKDDPGEKSLDSDWGFSEEKKGMAKETKIALSLIFVLLVAFGYVVYQRLNKSEGLFRGSDDQSQMEIDKPESSSETKNENEFGPGTSIDGDPSNDKTSIGQRERVLPDWDDAFPDDSDSLRNNDITAGQPPDRFNPANSEDPVADRMAIPQIDPSAENFESFSSHENFRGSDAYSETQTSFPDFDQERSLSQHDQPQNLDESVTGFGVKSLLQHEADLSPEEEMTGGDFSNASEVAGDVRDADRNQFTQQTEPQQVRYSENELFLNKIPSQQERNPEQEAFSFGDQSAGETTVQPGQYDSNQFSQSPQYPVENYSQNGQADLNTGDSFRAEVAAENRYRPEIASSLDRNDRFGQYQEPNFAGEAASATTTTVRREEPGIFKNRFDVPGRFVEASSKNHPDVYEVQSGDNYWSISKKQYGTARYFLALSRYNRGRIPDENRMRPGMKAMTPSREILQTRYPDLFPKRSAQNSPSQKSVSTTTKTNQPSGFHRGLNREPLYRVGKEDTLTEISQRHLGRSSRWIQIYELNRSRLSSPNNLTIGTVLQLPADASNVRLVRNPQRDR